MTCVHAPSYSPSLSWRLPIVSLYLDSSFVRVLCNDLILHTLLVSCCRALWVSLSSRIYDRTRFDAVRPLVCILVFADCSLVTLEPAEQPGAESTQDTPVVVAELEAATGDEVLPEGGAGAVEELGASAATGIPVCVEAETPKVDEDEVVGTVSVAVDDGLVDFATEHVIDDAVGANGEPPSSYPEVLDEAEEAAPDTNVVDKASKGGVIPAEPEDQSSAWNAEEGIAADLAIDLAESGATEKASAPAVERATEPEPAPEPEPEPAPAVTPVAELAAEPGVKGVADFCANTVIDKELTVMADEGKLTVRTIVYALLVLFRDFAHFVEDIAASTHVGFFNQNHFRDTMPNAGVHMAKMPYLPPTHVPTRP